MSTALGAHLDAVLPYDLTQNVSNIDNTRSDDTHALDYDNLNFLTQTVSISVGVEI